MTYANAIELIKHWEGCVLHSYLDTSRVWTIGYGTTHGVTAGQTCTKAQALEWLARDVDTCAKAVRSFVKVDVSDHQVSALISLSYNIGINGLRTSTLIKKLNAKRPIAEVADEFLRWVHGGGRVVPGLVNRRKEERLVFLTPDVSVREIA